MRPALLALLILSAGLSQAKADFDFVAVDPIEANDIGGIIAWSPYNYRFARKFMRVHCARYGKLGRITSVTPRYGAYIAFACRFPRGYVVRHHRRPRSVLRVRY